MKSTTYRIVVGLVLAALVTLAVVQIYWFRAAYQVQEERFDENVNLALRSVAYNLSNPGDISREPIPPITKSSENVFFVGVSSFIDYRKLDSLLRIEFKRFGISEKFQLAIYNENNTIVLGALYDRGADSGQTACLDRSQDFATMNFAVSFPDRNSQILGGIELWTFSAATFASIIVILGFILVDIVRRKKFAESKNDFINNMTHELKTPIANISMASEVLGNNPAWSDERKTRYIDIIQKENNRLKLHVEQVLQAAKEGSGLEFRKERVDLHRVVTDVIRDFRFRIDERGGKLETSLSARTPFINGDAMHLTNMMYNLLDNAEKYCLGTPHIIVTTEDQPGGLRLSVVDNGMGIDASEHNAIFEKFYRAHTGNVHDVKGFGLGLNYVRKIVDAHEGKIKVSSEIDKGSCFEVLLPAIA